MATMGKYCKAYPLARFSEFPSWASKAVATTAGSQPEEKSTSDYLFLHTNYVVTEGVYIDERVVFDAVTDDWISFCRENLKFEAPQIGEPASA
jgi:hypothetical protein